MDAYRAIKSKKTMYHLINEAKKQDDNNISDAIAHDCIEIAKNLLYMPYSCMMHEEYIDGYDIFGDDYMFWVRENEDII